MSLNRTALEQNQIKDVGFFYLSFDRHIEFDEVQTILSQGVGCKTELVRVGSNDDSPHIWRDRDFCLGCLVSYSGIDFPTTVQVHVQDKYLKDTQYLFFLEQICKAYGGSVLVEDFSMIAEADYRYIDERFGVLALLISPTSQFRLVELDSAKWDEGATRISRELFCFLDTLDHL